MEKNVIPRVRLVEYSYGRAFMIEIIGRKDFDVCEEFAKWYKKTFGNRACYLDQLYDAIDRPSWLNYFILNACYTESAAKEIRRLLAHDHFWLFNSYDQPAMKSITGSRQFREVIPLEVVLDSLPVQFHEQYNKFNARPAKPEKAITITGSTGMRISAVKALRDISAEPLDLKAAVDIIDRLPTPFTLSKWKGSRTSAVNTLRAASLIVA